VVGRCSPHRSLVERPLRPGPAVLSGGAAAPSGVDVARVVGLGRGGVVPVQRRRRPGGPPSARHPSRSRRALPAVVGCRLPRPRRAPGRRRIPAGAQRRPRREAGLMGHHHGTTSGADVALVVVLLVAGGYLLLSRRAGRRNPGRRWSRWRTASFLTGLALLAVALSPPVAPWAHDDFRGHMVQHMLVGMYAPL